MSGILVVGCVAAHPGSALPRFGFLIDIDTNDLAMTTSTDSKVSSPRPGANIDYVRWVLIAGIAISSLIVLAVARNTLVRPFDSLVTEQACRSHGEEIQRPLIEFERSNRFAISDRTEGFCLYGPGEGGDGTARFTLEEVEPGSVYTMAKVAGIILQLGVTSIFLRLVTDPALALYRYLRHRFG